MLSNLKEAFFWTLTFIMRISAGIGFGFAALWGWLSGFSEVTSVTSFVMPKISLVLIGKLLTPFPWWVLIALSFAPPPLVMTLFFVMIIVVLKQ